MKFVQARNYTRAARGHVEPRALYSKPVRSQLDLLRRFFP